MFTKGIDYYAFLDTDNLGATFYAPGSAPVSYRSSSPMSKGNFQILGGKFAWEVVNSNRVLTRRFAEITPLAGNLLRSNLKSMMSTRSIVTPDFALSYGFYDCGVRRLANHLTNQDQSYVYLTGNYSEWMKDLAGEKPEFLDRSLKVLVLPGAHDAGMFETFNFKQLLDNKYFLDMVRARLARPLARDSKDIGFDLADSAERIVTNLACTQKDDISTMLDLGIRYFDFRPGYCYGPLRYVPELENGIFHQHAFIPGHNYYDFLCDILKWLATHPAEIVVVNLNFQGFEDASMKPSIDELVKQIRNAQSNTNTSNIAIGGKDDLNLPIKLLLKENKRLIFLNQINMASDAPKYDSYNNSLYATTDVNNILTALKGMQPLPQNKEVYTVLQLQGTSTADPTACSTSILDVISPGSSDSMSPLMSTKSGFDNSTYPWLANNAPGNFSANCLLVLLNDFVDNALVKHAIEITRKRIDLWVPDEKTPIVKEVEVIAR
jgi:hypothetical protein